MSLQSAFNKYFSGDPNKKIGPFRNIQGSDLNVKYNKYGRDHVHAFKRLMDFMDVECKRLNFRFENRTDDQLKVLEKIRNIINNHLQLIHIIILSYLYYFINYQFSSIQFSYEYQTVILTSSLTS